MNINDQARAKIWNGIRITIIDQVSGYLSQEDASFVWKKTATEVSDSIFPVTLHARVHLREEDFLKNSKKSR